jgi:hypothetical protein
VCFSIYFIGEFLVDAIFSLYSSCTLYPRVCKNVVRGEKKKHRLFPSAIPFRYLCMLHVSSSCSFITFLYVDFGFGYLGLVL